MYLLVYSTLHYSILIVAILFNFPIMPNKGKGHYRLPMAAHFSQQSKAATVVDIQYQNIEVHQGIQSLRNPTASLFDSENPTKRARKMVMDTADTLLSL